mgnify:CR=1 FL=1
MEIINSCSCAEQHHNFTDYLAREYELTDTITRIERKDCFEAYRKWANLYKHNLLGKHCFMRNFGKRYSLFRDGSKFYYAVSRAATAIENIAPREEIVGPQKGGFVYLVRVAGEPEDSFKVGMSQNIHGKRAEDYPAGSTCYVRVIVDNPLAAEAQIVDVFSRRFQNYKGREYFRGDRILMRRTFLEICEVHL